MRDQQYERKREFAVSAFQRKSILALQIAVTDLIKAAYSELDRMIAESAKTGTWPVRQWETRLQSVGPNPC